MGSSDIRLGEIGEYVLLQHHSSPALSNEVFDSSAGVMLMKECEASSRVSTRPSLGVEEASSVSNEEFC